MLLSSDRRAAGQTRGFFASTFTNGERAIGHNLYTKGNLIYEANYMSGLRVFDATDPLNPTEVRYFDTWPGNTIIGFRGLWSVYPYFPSGVVIGSDLEKGLFVWWVDDPLVQITYPSGIPLAIDPNGDSLVIQLNERDPGDLEPGSGTLHVDAGDGCMNIPLVDLGNGSFRADFPVMECAREVRWYISARSTNGITWQSPDSAPRTTHLSFSGSSVVTAFEDDAETDQGWLLSEPTDTATHGHWERSDPPGGRGAPSIDHSDVGTKCFHTSTGANVNNGRVGLRTPFMDLSEMQNPRIDYWRWYSSRLGTFTNHERMRIEISNVPEETPWTEVEILGLVNNLENLIGWFHHGFFVRDLIEPSTDVRVRFRAKDLNTADIIEAAIDDFRLVDVRCDCAAPVSVCSTAPNSAGPGAVIGSLGTTSVVAADLTLTVTGAIPDGNGLFYYGPNSIQVPFGDGFRCAGGATERLFPLVSLDGSGDGSHALDFASPPVGSGPNMVTPGSTWTFQFWYRDNAAGGAGFNLSDGLEATFCQ